jgi:hypothetical protein
VLNFDEELKKEPRKAHATGVLYKLIKKLTSKIQSGLR